MLRIDPDADPDSSCHFDADPETTFHCGVDLNTDPTFFADSDLDPVPRQIDTSLLYHWSKDLPRPNFEPSYTSIVSVYGPPLLQPALDFDADPDMDPDPAS